MRAGPQRTYGLDAALFVGLICSWCSSRHGKYRRVNEVSARSRRGSRHRQGARYSPLWPSSQLAASGRAQDKPARKLSDLRESQGRFEQDAGRGDVSCSARNTTRKREKRATTRWRKIRRVAGQMEKLPQGRGDHRQAAARADRGPSISSFEGRVHPLRQPGEALAAAGRRPSDPLAAGVHTVDARSTIDLKTKYPICPEKLAI